MKTIFQQLSPLLVLLCLHQRSAQSVLIIFPRDTEVLVNKSAYFNCSTSILGEQIHWFHYRVGENRTNYVYYRGQLNSKIYAERYYIEINTKTGEYNLIIRSVQPGDAGRYVCQDDGGLGDLGSAELIVLDSTPTCLSNVKLNGFIGPNNCYLPLGTLQLSCSVSYIGNIPPILQWKIDGNDSPILEGLTNDYSGKRATVNLTMVSMVEMDGESFTCGAARSQDKKLSCITDPAKIKYAVGQPKIMSTAKGENLTCSVNASVPCTYRWFYNNDTQSPVSYNQLLTTNRLGNHSCEASCPINGISCTFVAMRIIVFEEETSTKTENTELQNKNSILLNTVTVLQSRGDIIQRSIKEAAIITRASREMSRAIAGVAALDDMIYIVSDRSSEVEIFDIRTYEFKNRYNFVELENPWDLTSCKLNNCLYIMDIRSPTTPKYVIRVDTNVKTMVLWSTGEEYGNLSVTSDGNVIVTFCDSRRLVIYRPDGMKLNVISLPEDIIHPSHALQLRNGQFLICHGTNEDNIHRLCVLNEDGDITKCSFEWMDEPSYLAVDDNDLIFVADQGNSRVIVLNPDLELIEEVASKQNGLRGPQRICLNVKTGKLLVVDNEVLEFKRRDGKLLIFPMTYDHHE